MDYKELKRCYREALKWDDYANKLKLAGSLAILFLMILFTKCTGIMENSGQILVFIILLTVVLIIVWQVWIGMYCKKRKNSILSPEEQKIVMEQMQRELMETLSGKKSL